MNSHKVLMVMSSDRISEWIQKGEVTARYYNPGDLFDEIHIVLMNQENPDARALQQLCGRARFQVHCFPTGIPHFAKTLLWTPALLRRWAEPIVQLARNVQPQLVRCHGNFVNAFAAREIKRKLGVPYVISMHINPDVDVRGRRLGALRRIRDLAWRRFEGDVLREADLVMPVYRPIVPYLQRHGVKRFEVAYNFLNIDHLKLKENYRLHSPVKILSVGRQIDEKNPDNLLRAIAALPGTQLTLVGNGPRHKYLQEIATGLQLGERVVFRPVVPNDELCSMLPEFDIFATHSEYWEISKSVLEPLLTGLPVVINRRLGEPVPELTEDICRLVDNTTQSYRTALQELIAGDANREALGRGAALKARSVWAPEITEAKFAEIYRRLIAENGR